MQTVKTQFPDIMSSLSEHKLFDTLMVFLQDFDHVTFFAIILD